MAKHDKNWYKIDKEELTMYLLLFIGLAAILILFAVNIILIDRIMMHTIEENQLLRQNLNMVNSTEESSSSDTSEIVIDDGGTDTDYSEF